MNKYNFLLLLFWFGISPIGASKAFAQDDRVQVDFIQDVLFHTEYKSAPARNCKLWIKPPKLSVFGDGDLHEKVVTNVVKQLNACLPRDRKIEVLPNHSPEATLKVYFMHHDQMPTMAEGMGFQYFENNWGFFYSWWNTNHEIERSVVMIANDKLSGYRLHHYVLEEITQSLGFPGDSKEDPKSVFYEDASQKEFGKATLLSKQDRELIRFHYSSNQPGAIAVQVGMNFAHFLDSRRK